MNNQLDTALMCNRTDCAGTWAGPMACARCEEVENMAGDIIFCECCGRQVINNGGDKYTAPRVGAVQGFGRNVICGDCARDLDENGCFPEEAIQ